MVLLVKKLVCVPSIMTWLNCAVGYSFCFFSSKMSILCLTSQMTWLNCAEENPSHQRDSAAHKAGGSSSNLFKGMSELLTYWPSYHLKNVFEFIMDPGTNGWYEIKTSQTNNTQKGKMIKKNPCQSSNLTLCILFSSNLLV